MRVAIRPSAEEHMVVVLRSLTVNSECSPLQQIASVTLDLDAIFGDDAGRVGVDEVATSKT